MFDENNFFVIQHVADSVFFLEERCLWGGLRGSAAYAAATFSFFS
jgi:hypothetical protein